MNIDLEEFNFPARRRKSYVVIQVEESIGSRFKELAKKYGVTQTQYMEWLMKMAKKQYDMEVANGDR